MRVINLVSCLITLCSLSTASESGLLVEKKCQGYSASNVVKHDRGLTADLDLIGEGCRIYGPDLPKLRLTVEYETGKSMIEKPIKPHPMACILMYRRH